MASKILVIGATGGVGKHVVSQLLAHTPQPSLRVSSRDPSKVKVPSNVEVVKGDISDPSTFPTLFNGVGKVFLYLQGTDNTAQAVATAAKAAGVHHVVFLSSVVVLSEPSYIGQRHIEVEEAIKGAGLTYTFLRPGGFSTNAIKQWAPQIKHKNKVSVPFINAHSAPIAGEDIAEVAVVALTSNKLDNAAPVLSGPGSISHREQLEILSKVRKEVKGVPLEYEEVTGEQWKAAVTGSFPTPIIDAMLKLWKNTDGVPQPISPEYKKITGKEGTSYAEWVKLHASELF